MPGLVQQQAAKKYQSGFTDWFGVALVPARIGTRPRCDPAVMSRPRRGPEVRGSTLASRCSGCWLLLTAKR